MFKLYKDDTLIKESGSLKDIRKFCKLQKSPKWKLTLCHIGGYELLRDGTRKETVRTAQELVDLLKDHECLPILKDALDTSNTDFINTLEASWNARYDDGGGSGWFEENAHRPTDLLKQLKQLTGKNK